MPSTTSTDIPKERPNPKIYFFAVLVLIAGGIIAYPNINYSYYLAQGDHGRDLYSFKKTFEGGVPYRDYSSQNGPLMPYYYSIFYHLFGLSVQSTLIGYQLLILFSGLMIYLICSRFLDPPISIIAALWYWAFRGNGFFYTFNHDGAILTYLIVIYLLFQYIRSKNNMHIYLAAFFSFLTILIRPNIGAGTLVVFLIAAALTDISNKTRPIKTRMLSYFALGTLVLGASWLIYWLLVKDLPKHVSEHDLAYWKFAKLVHTTAMFNKLIELIKDIFSTPARALFFGLFTCINLRGIFLLLKNRIDQPLRRQLILCMFSLLLFLIMLTLEFAFHQRFFRIMWAFPAGTLFFFFLIHTGLKGLHQILRGGILLMLLVLSGYILLLFRLQNFEYRIPENHLKVGSNSVYVASQHQEWVKTVTQASQYLRTHVPPSEKILAIRYAPLYYFLSERDSALVDLRLADGQDRERHYLNVLKRGEVNTVLIENRAIRNEEAPQVIFGKTYQKALAAYIYENFEEVAQFGPWDKTAGWMRNHAVKIFRRIRTD